MGSPEGPLIPIATITRTQGLRGVVRVRIDFDDPRLFEPGRNVVLTLGDRRTESSIEFFRSQHGRWVLKVEGIESISEAETWIGGQVSIAKDDLPEPEEGGYFDFQLKGCTVYENGLAVGQVVEVVDFAGGPQLRIDRDGREVLIPFVRDFLREIDLEKRRIDVEVPEGLLDLNP